MEMILMDKKTLIIILLSVILVIILAAIGYILPAGHTEYVSETISESQTSFEMPKDMTVKSNNSDSGIVVYENDNTIIVVFNSQDKGVAQIMAFANIKNPIFGNEFSGNLTMNNPVISGCSLDGECNAVFIGNNDTHDNIIVISKNKDIVNHIINVVKNWLLTFCATRAHTPNPLYANTIPAVPETSEPTTEMIDFVLKSTRMDNNVPCTEEIDPITRIKATARINGLRRGCS